MNPAATTRAVLAVAAFVALSYMIVRVMITFTGSMMLHAFSLDMGWMLQAGRYIVAHGTLPATDIFSWTAAGRDWLLYQWLFEVLVALGERLVGMDGLVRAMVFVVAVVYLVAPGLVGVPRRVPLFVTLLIGVTALKVASYGMGLRPMVATTVFLAAQYVLVQRYRRGDVSFPSLAVILAVVYVLWANMHMGVFLGLVSLAAMGLGDALERRRLYRFQPIDAAIEGAPAAPRQFAVLLAIGLAASFANPYGPAIYPYLFELSLKTEVNAFIPELRPPDFRNIFNQLLLVLMIAAALPVGRARRFYAAGDLLHLVVFTALTLVAVRFIIWAALFYALILPRAYHHVWTLAKDRVRVASGPVLCLEAARTPYLAGVAAAALVFGVVQPHLLAPFQRGECEYVLPAIDAYQRIKSPSDRLFTDHAVGSCVIYADPATKVFIDSRLDFYDPAFIVATLGSLYLANDWRGLLDAWEVDTFILLRQWPLAGALSDMDGAEVLYTDPYATIVRRSR